MKAAKHQSAILTYIQGNYLYYLSQVDYPILIPVTNERQEDYYGRENTLPFGENAIEIADEEVRNQRLRCREIRFLIDKCELLLTNRLSPSETGAGGKHRCVKNLISHALHRN